MSSSFADRLWWARHRFSPPMGSTTLARKAGCSQALISILERNDADGSKYDKALAEALQVDPNWLAHGIEDKAPPGFDAEAARQGRENMVRASGRQRLEPSLPEARSSWPVGAAPLEVLTGADEKMKTLVGMFWDFAREAGAERTEKFLDLLRHVAASVAFERSGGKDQVAAPDKRN